MMAIKKRKVTKITPVKQEDTSVEETVQEEVEEEEVEETVEQTAPVAKEKVEEVKEPKVDPAQLKEEAEKQLQLDLDFIIEGDSDFVKIDQLGLLLKDILALENIKISQTAATRVNSRLGNIVLELMQDHGKRVSLGSKQFRKGHNRARVFKAKEGFTSLDTLSFPHDNITINIPVAKKDNIKGQYNEEEDLFTTEDGKEYIVEDLNE